MQVQEIFLNASESYEENGSFELSQNELDFLLNRFTELNQNGMPKSLQIQEAKGIVTILLYAEKEDFITNLELSSKMRELFEKVYNEFCADEES